MVLHVLEDQKITMPAFLVHSIEEEVSRVHNCFCMSFMLNASPVVAVADHAVAIKDSNNVFLRPITRILLCRHQICNPCLDGLAVNQMPLSCYER